MLLRPNFVEEIVEQSFARSALRLLAGRTCG